MVIGSSWSTNAASTMANSGWRPLRMLASADGIHWEPHVRSTAGTATLRSPSSAIRGSAPGARGMRPRVATSTPPRNSVASVIRHAASVNGPIPSLRPTLMNRNEAPQASVRPTNIAQTTPSLSGPAW